MDGRKIQNAILRDLPAEERDLILPKLELVNLPAQAVLNEINEPIKHCYFVDGGLVSIINVMPGGKSVEVGISGKEGFIGLPVAVDFEVSLTRAVTQTPVSALKVGVGEMRTALQSSPNLEKYLHRYAQELALQAAQLAACNRLHEVDERLARWLLMSQDRIGGSRLPLTQSSLASMLGTRRASVTIAAGMLQKAGLISCKRGAVVIKNRAKLEGAACACYRILDQRLKRWHESL